MYKKHTEAAGHKHYVKEILIVGRITTILYFLASGNRVRSWNVSREAAQKL